MANTRSAKKAFRASMRKRKFNLAKENRIKEAVKNFKKSVTTGAKDVENQLAKVYKSFDKAVKTNFIHKKTAARKKSRLVAMMRKALNK